MFLALVTSAPVIVNMACFFANDWGIYTLLTEGPNFLSTVMGKDIATVRLDFAVRMGRQLLTFP